MSIAFSGNALGEKGFFFPSEFSSCCPNSQAAILALESKLSLISIWKHSNMSIIVKILSLNI